MDFIPAQCAVRSLGPANDLLNLLIQTLIASYCTISDPGWPPNCENPTDGGKIKRLHFYWFNQYGFVFKKL